ncbi:MAG: hypothetical protein V3R29_04290 [Candidatus Acidoferrales bacterium]
MKKAIVVIGVVVGLVTFFLPLVGLQAPLVGEQKISGWDVVKPGEKQGRDDLGLRQTLEKLQGNFLRKTKKEVPLAVKQAQALVVTLPLAYLSLLLAGVFALWAKWRPLPVTAAVGLLGGVYSLISVFWLSGGVKEMVAESGGRFSGVPLLGRLSKSAAEQVEVSPELGLYLLVAVLAVVLLAGVLPGGKR